MLKKKSAKQKVKDEIQKMLRMIVVERDGGCVFRHFPEIAGRCGPAGTRGGILQADHIMGRTASKTYADPDNVICLCLHHHLYWKPSNPTFYTDLVKKIIGTRKYNRLKAASKPKPLAKSRDKEDWQKELTKLGIYYGRLLKAKMKIITINL